MNLTTVTEWLVARKPGPGDLKRDAVAAIPVAVSSVPDGMATAALIGINPIQGLYASIVGPIVGGLLARTSRMVIVTTTASGLAAGSALQGVASEDVLASLFLLTMIAGALMVVAGIIRLGRYTRFVSQSVMVGFLTGVSVALILGQISSLLAVTAEGRGQVAKFWDVITRPGDWRWAALLVGVSTVVIILLLQRTSLAPIGAVVGLALPALAVALLDLGSVPIVSDGGAVPGGLPVPAMPHFGLITFDMVFGAAAIAVIVLVQGFGVAQSVPEPGSHRSDGNGNFIAQGGANLATGFFQGMPVGGSVGTTALLQTSGGRSRWGGIFVGIWVAVILLALSSLIGFVASASLAAILIYAGVSSINVGNIMTVWQTATISRVAMMTTFVATLVFSVPEAVAIGLVVSLLMQLNQENSDLRVVERVDTERGIIEREPPRQLPSDAVTVLDVYGSLFFAGARTLRVRLPDPTDARRAVVVLSIRGRNQLGATALGTLGEYGRSLAEGGGRLYLSGVSPPVMSQLTATGVVVEGPVTAYPADELVGESTRLAVEDARTWLVHGMEAGSETGSTF